MKDRFIIHLSTALGLTARRKRKTAMTKWSLVYSLLSHSPFIFHSVMKMKIDKYYGMWRTSFWRSRWNNQIGNLMGKSYKSKWPFPQQKQNLRKFVFFFSLYETQFRAVSSTEDSRQFCFGANMGTLIICSCPWRGSRRAAPRCATYFRIRREKVQNKKFVVWNSLIAAAYLQ